MKGGLCSGCSRVKVMKTCWICHARRRQTRLSKTQRDATEALWQRSAAGAGKRRAAQDRIGGPVGTSQSTVPAHTRRVARTHIHTHPHTPYVRTHSTTGPTCSHEDARGNRQINTAGFWLENRQDAPTRGRLACARLLAGLRCAAGGSRLRSKRISSRCPRGPAACVLSWRGQRCRWSFREGRRRSALAPGDQHALCYQHAHERRLIPPSLSAGCRHSATFVGRLFLGFDEACYRRV